MRSEKTGILLESGTNEVEFMEFFLAGESYGVNVAKVIRVMSARETSVTAVAGVDPSVLGVVYDHGKPVRLIDLKRALAMETALSESAAERQLILITRFNNEPNAFVIDGVHKIHRTSWDKFQPLAEGSMEGSAVIGTVQVEDRLVQILDLERIMLQYGDSRFAQAAKAAPTPTLAERRAKLRLVYAEDSRMVRRLTLDAFAAAGFTEVKSFENGELALAYLNAEFERAKAEKRSLRERVDAIVTDIEMPRMDGLTFCKNVKALGPAETLPRVVVYSSLISDQMRHKCKAVGTDAELSKPQGDDVIKAVDRLCLNLVE